MLCLLVPLTLQVGLPIATDIFARCQKAYDSVKSFEQDVSGEITGMKGSAHISFVRPDHLRVTGDTMFGTKYDLISDGKATWLLSNGAWSKVDSPEMGIASITGISANAGTLVPALLTHSQWGSLPGKGATGYTVKLETLDGKKLFRINGTSPFVTSTWVDPTTYFVVKTESSVMKRTITVRFPAPKVNAPIPPSRFKK